MEFLTPLLAKCSNRMEHARESMILPSPQAMTSNELLSGYELFGISFDFFIDWPKGRLNRDFWLKCPVRNLTQDELWRSRDEVVTDALRRHRAFRDLVKFASANECSAKAVIFDDGQQWGSEKASLLLAHWPGDAKARKGLEIKRILLPQLEELIKMNSGGPVSIGGKGLIYSTSSLECHLSKSDALWPGDADLLICDISTMRPVALIEYKKHTQSSTISFKDQKLSNYYPKPDGRKYDRLALLAEQIAPGESIPIFTLYYSTVGSELSIKLERIVGSARGLRSGGECAFDVSPDDPESAYRQLIIEIVRQSGFKGRV